MTRNSLALLFLGPLIAAGIVLAAPRHAFSAELSCTDTVASIAKYAGKHDAPLTILSPAQLADYAHRAHVRGADRGFVVELGGRVLLGLEVGGCLMGPFDITGQPVMLSGATPYGVFA